MTRADKAYFKTVQQNCKDIIWYLHNGKQLKAECDALKAEVERLTKLAYLGEHHFDDLTYKARLEECIKALRAEQKHNKRLREALAGLHLARTQGKFCKLYCNVEVWNEIRVALQRNANNSDS